MASHRGRAPTCKPATKPRAAPLANGLTIYAAPNPLTAGRQLTVFGSLVGVQHGIQRCGIEVVLWRRFPAQHGFSPVPRTVTNTASTYSFVMPAGSVATNRYWMVTARGLTSRTVAQHVRPSVTLASTATFAVAGDAETLSGQLEPGNAGEVVSLQRRVGPRWQTVARPRLKRDGTFAVAHTFSTGRTEQWRAMVPSSVHNLAAASATLKIKIAPLTGIHKIKHVVIIMQENRSFDSYFGTYPAPTGFRPGVRPRPGRTAAASPRFTTPQTSTTADRIRSTTPSPTSTAAGWTASSARPSRG